MTPLESLGKRARTASQVVATASTAAKDAALHAAADLLEAGSDQVLAANAGDVEAAEQAGTTPSGTRTWRISNPLGRTQPSTVWPTGSASRAT